MPEAFSFADQELQSGSQSLDYRLLVNVLNHLNLIRSVHIY